MTELQWHVIDAAGLFGSNPVYLTVDWLCANCGRHTPPNDPRYGGHRWPDPNTCDRCYRRHRY